MAFSSPGGVRICLAYLRFGQACGSTPAVLFVLPAALFVLPAVLFCDTLL